MDQLKTQLAAIGKFGFWIAMRVGSVGISGHLVHEYLSLAESE